MNEETSTEVWNMLINCGMSAIDLRLTEWDGRWHIGITDEAGDVVVWIDQAHIERVTGI